MEQTKNKKKGIIIGVVVSLLLIVTLGITYAYWQYSNSLGNQTLVAGDIYMKYSETGDEISITNAMPANGPDETKHFDFTIAGRNNYSKPIWYEIVLSHGTNNSGRNTRLEDEFLRFRLVEIKGDERKVVVDNASYKELEKGQKIWVNTIDANTSSNIEIKYELYMWIAFETRIGNTEGNDYTMEEWNDVFASIKVSVNGDFEEKKVPLPESAQKVLDGAKVAEANTDVCKKSPIIEDEDGTVYFSGTNDCVNFNYVWYSGKLWRIVAINPDGSMKLVTQDMITTITWGADTTYKNSDKASWIYQWLNEDFKETLYNYENIIVQNADWNATADASSPPVRPDSNGTIVTGDVGLLNAYEYSQAYKNASTSTNYLKIGYDWWLITPHSGSYVRFVVSSGSLNTASPTSFVYGVRPSINLKSNIEIVSGGDGSENNPYRINGDKESGNSGELINTRLSGEYVKVDNKYYRIVGIEKDENGNNITKLTSVDYVRDGSGVLKKNFGSNISWATSVETDSEDKYWSYYLNNTKEETFEGTWLTSELYKYIVKGKYYLGQYSDIVSYKNTICSESNTIDRTSSCEKTTSTWTGLVGLPRVGEMFSAQLGSYSTSSSSIWLITPYSGSRVRFVGLDSTLDESSPSSNTYGVRPSINLKSEVKITGGDGRTEETAYTIGL